MIYTRLSLGFRANSITSIVKFSDKWRQSLGEVMSFYDRHKPPLKKLFPRLFLFFMAVNIFCYWWATATAFPSSITGAFVYYFKIQFPVGILGALFDSLSFFVTLYIIRSALRSQRTFKFIGHLSIDLIIAIAATFWVLFVFSLSSWLIRLTETDPEFASELYQRQEVYRQRMENALAHPSENKRNIYFGVVMGFSAILPTLFHVYMAFRSNFKSVPSWMKSLETKLISWVSRRSRSMNGIL